MNSTRENRTPQNGQKSRGWWHDTARRLHKEDPSRSNGSIAREIGVTTASVWKLLNPVSAAESRRKDNARRRDAKRAWEREHYRSPEGRATCVACGGPCGVASAHSGAEFCMRCIQRGAHERALRFVEMWRDGAKLREIAADLGTSLGCAQVTLHTLRQKGYDLPYRRRRAM